MVYIVRFLLLVYLVFVFTDTVFGASCSNGYEVMAHDIDFDFNINTKLPDAVTASTKALNTNTFILSDDGNCYSGFDSYSRTDDYIYPIVESSILCPEGQYMANGTCTTYSAGTCPENMLNTTTNTATWTTMTNGACPSNYVAETISAIEFACDTYDSQITSETPACLLMCTNGNVFTEVNSCAPLCPEYHKLMTSTGLEIPIYATKQITPSINMIVGNNTCYVNLVPGKKTGAIHVKYNDTTYHTVK